MVHSPRGQFGGFVKSDMPFASDSAVLAPGVCPREDLCSHRMCTQVCDTVVMVAQTGTNQWPCSHMEGHSSMRRKTSS